MQSFKLKFSGVTILQGVKFPIFLLIFEWALQQFSATVLPVISVSPFEACEVWSFFVTEWGTGYRKLQMMSPGSQRVVLWRWRKENDMFPTVYVVNVMMRQQLNRSYL